MCSLRSPTTSSYGKTDERAKWRKYPRILEAMEKKGYFDMTPEERIKKALEINQKLVGSGIGDYEAGKEALNEMRGGGIA
ncbi:hypothetical protein FJZ31_18005 [Candidatus Poribacteria bacterium]|nr:hypothetical protein [Candidatus Poribacteria bacterium]